MLRSAGRRRPLTAHSSTLRVTVPIDYLRAFTIPERSDAANRRLGRSLAFVAGAANAGGFFAVGQYTSHMSGIVSSMADNLALGDIGVVVAGFSSLLSFLVGAATSAILINWGRRRHLSSQYAMPLILEATLLLLFGLLGSGLETHQVLFVPATVCLLCYVMGLQNAMITKISKAEIRTTHVTGLVTDIGIELGKLLYWNLGTTHRDLVRADRQKLLLLGSLLLSFLVGGLAGAVGFRHVGFMSSVPLAIVLVTLAVVPIFDDMLARRRWPKR
nr:YoaK family protein [Burkholderia multivorans]